MRVMLDESIAVGPGKIELLEALEQHGSISAAAKAMGMSYRRAWLLVDELNACLKYPAVCSATGGVQGGGSILTREGRQLVALYRTIEQRAQEACAKELSQLLGQFQKQAPKA